MALERENIGVQCGETRAVKNMEEWEKGTASFT
jgi:hypothetical protein